MCFYSDHSLHFGNGGDINHLSDVSLCGGTNSYCGVYIRMSILFAIVSVLLERQTDRQRQIDNDTGRQTATDRQTDKDTYRQL